MYYISISSCDFVQKEFLNIRTIAARHGELFDDAIQETHLIILENREFYDPSKGSFESYIFGLLHHSIRRKTFGPSRFAISIDADCPATENCIQDLEKISLEKFNEASADLNLVVGHATLKSVADAIASRSSTEIGRSLKRKRPTRPPKIIQPNLLDSPH